MASGISDAKARRNSKTKAMGRAKLGLPAKAGKRKPGWKAHKRSYDSYGRGFIMQHEVKIEAIKPRGDVLRRGMDIIRNMERSTPENSDPFRWNRMRTHFAGGLIDFAHLTDKA
jgi:hypothetical protein